MSSQNPRFLKIELTLNSSQPELLEGLDLWLRLGLLTDAQVRQLCQQSLTCPLPTVSAKANVPASRDTKTEDAQSNKVLIPSGDFFVPQQSAASQQQTASAQEPPNRVTRILQSLMAELSVRWLLFLGVFMVVVSSGLLAATQWEKFPAFGQYGVLLAYTLIFWGVSFWAGKQRNLQLTAQTLQLVTLFLVPVNFWAMDGFRLWGNPLEWLTVAIASVILSAIALLLFRDQRRRFPLFSLSLLNYLGLSYLHWGWGFSGFPLIAVYLGIIGTAISTFYLYRPVARGDGGAEERGSGGAEEPGSGGAEERGSRGAGEQRSGGAEENFPYTPHPIPNSPLPLPSPSPSYTVAVIYAVAVLLVRAIVLTQPRVEIAQLGLAIGICGWLLTWLSQQRPNPLTSSPPFSQLNWEVIGGIFLFLGWLVSVGNYPWQALAVSGIGLRFFDSRIKRFWRRVDLAAFLGIGLQAIWLFWRLIPPETQRTLIATATQLTGSENYPYALLSLVLFPYLIFIVGIADWLYRRQKVELAQFAEAIALLFGFFLTLIGLINPLLRSLNLLASTVTLAIVTQKRPRIVAVYLTHISGLLTICSAIDYLWPNLNQDAWIAILLALTIAEWTFSIIWSRREGNTDSSPSPASLSLSSSAWHLGLSLAMLSYSICVVSTSNSTGRLLWLITPLALTGVATWAESSRRQLAAWLSVGANIMAQILLLTIPEARLFSLGLATMLMFVNTRYLQHLASAAITVGFGLIFFAQMLWDGFLGFPQQSLSAWLIAFAIALDILWLGRSWLIRQSSNLTLIYTKAFDGWAIALCSLELFLLTFHSSSIYSGFLQTSFGVLIAIILTFLAIAYRSWQEPNNWAIYALAWSLELLTAEILGFVDRSVINLSIANIALGLLTQLLGDFWRRKVGANNFPVSLHIVPLAYGIFGAVLRWGNFTNWTGLSSMAIALIAIGVGRRRQEFKPLLYLGLLGVSVSAYELLFYQLLQTSGGSFGDGLIAMAALGTSIMYAYRVLSPWLLQYLNITKEELKTIAHLHWVWSSCLLMAAIFSPIQSSRFVGLGVGLFLIQYAILQGRNHPNPRTAEIWVYLGLLEAAGTRIFWLNTPVEVVFSEPLIPFRAAIACVTAYFFYILPWENWGWPKRPWLVAAIVWPLVIIWETKQVIHPVSLLIAAGFYIFVARFDRQIRFTYISALLIDWVLWRFFGDLRLTNALWYVTPLGLSLLYIAQVDPTLKLPEQRQSRHLLRILGTTTICLVSLWTEQWTGLGSGILSIVAIFAGLVLRIRAFLYIGTATFLINAFNQLVILNFRYSFFKWLVGLVVGIAFIWIAANFETRREQLTSLLRNWITELQNWE